MPLFLSGWIPGSLISVSFSAKSIQHISVKRNAAAKHAGVIVIDGFDPNLPLSHRGQKRNQKVLVDAGNLALAVQHAPARVLRPPLNVPAPSLVTSPAIVRVVGSGVVGKVEDKFKQAERLTYSLAGEIDAYGARKAATVHGLLLAGPSGAGKTFAMLNPLEKIAVADKLRWGPDDKIRTQLVNGVAEFKPAHQVITGCASKYAIYAALARRKEAGEVSLLDDLEGPLKDKKSISFLLAATDSYEVRHLARGVRPDGDEAAPPEIDYLGTVGIITNLPLFMAKGDLKANIDALASRFEILELPIYTREEMMEWVRHVGLDLGMLTDGPEGLSPSAARECVEYLEKRTDLRPELRLLKTKIARRRKEFPSMWRQYCDDEISAWGAPSSVTPAPAPKRKPVPTPPPAPPPAPPAPPPVLSNPLFKTPSTLAPVVPLAPHLVKKKSDP